MTTKKLVFQLLARALLDIRISAFETDNKRVFGLSDLFHNVPYQMEGANDDADYEEIVRFLHSKAQQKGMTAWLDHAISEISKPEIKGLS